MDFTKPNPSRHTALARFSEACGMIARLCRKVSFVLLAKVRCKRLTLGKRNSLYVPVLAQGEGVLRIGSQNNFGFRLAPRTGSGRILLQARRANAELVIGDHNTISNNVSIIATERISIGNGCQIGDQVIIFDSDFHVIDPFGRHTKPGPSFPVIIGNNVWIGTRAMVLKGVTIGDNSVVGAMSLVTEPLPSNCIAAGIPARILGKIE